MNWLKNQISKETWSPYVAGILLGIVGILAVLLSNSLLGASGAFENLAGLVGKAIAPLAFNNMYFNFVMPAWNYLGRYPAGRRIFRRNAWRSHQ